MTVAEFYHVTGERRGTLPAFGPMRADMNLDAEGFAEIPHDVDLRRGIGGEVIDTHGDRDPEVPEVPQVLAQIFAAFPDCLGVFRGQVVPGYAAVHFQRPHRGDENHRGGLQMRLAAFDVEELLSAEVGPESRLRN